MLLLAAFIFVGCSSKNESKAAEKEDVKNVIATTIDSQSGPLIIDFTASWCGPCRQMKPIVAELSRKYMNQIKIVEVDVDDNDDISYQYGIEAIPTYIFIEKSGKEHSRLIGLQTKETLEQHISAIIGK